MDQCYPRLRYFNGQALHIRTDSDKRLCFTLYKRPTSAYHGCNADTKVFLYYIIHIIYIYLLLKSVYVIKNNAS
jgi:hypothetical protein